MPKWVLHCVDKSQKIVVIYVRFVLSKKALK